MVQTPPPTSRRDVALDAARAILMLLGIVLHVTAPYAPKSEWVLHDPESSQALDWLFHGIHLFRLPAFFWISGYFFAMTMSRGHAGTELARRLVRLVVPLAVTWMTLNVLQEVALALREHRDPVMAVLDGVPVGHLWFLVDLAIISLIAFVPLQVAHAPLRRVARSLNGALPVPALLLILTVCETLSVLGARATGVGYESIAGVTTLARVATYLPYFAAGIAMYHIPALRNVFLRIPPVLALVALPAGTWAATWRRWHDGWLAELAGPFEYLMVWICIGVVLQCFYRLVRRESRLVRLVCDSSYSVYLLHHFVVVLVAIALLPSGVGIGLKVAIGIVTTFALTTGIHVVWVAPSPLLRFLLNGRMPRRARRQEPAEWRPAELSSRAASSAS